MSSARSFVVASRLGVSTALAMFGLMVLGSLVRTTGSGLACPDWPLCQGRLIPAFDASVLIEWSHRTAALVVSLLLLATVVWTLAHAELRARLGGLAALAVALLVVQVLLGALTVWKLLYPTVVNGHLAVALLLFATMITFTLIAESRTVDAGSDAVQARPPHLLPILGLATTLTFVQAVLGGTVSSQHAGLACPDWPACNGEWFPPLGTLAGLQMLHRYAAYALTLIVGLAWLQSRSAPDPGVKAGASLAFGFNLAQIVLGVCNVLLGTPPWLSPLHLATASAMLALLVIATFRAAALPARAAQAAALSYR